MKFIFCVWMPDDKLKEPYIHHFRFRIDRVKLSRYGSVGEVKKKNIFHQPKRKHAHVKNIFLFSGKQMTFFVSSNSWRHLRVS